MRAGALILELVFMIRDYSGVSGDCVARVIGDAVGPVFGADARPVMDSLIWMSSWLGQFSRAWLGRPGLLALSHLHSDRSQWTEELTLNFEWADAIAIGDTEVHFSA